MVAKSYPCWKGGTPLCHLQIAGGVICLSLLMGMPCICPWEAPLAKRDIEVRLKEEKGRVVRVHSREENNKLGFIVLPRFIMVC